MLSLYSSLTGITNLIVSNSNNQSIKYLEYEDEWIKLDNLSRTSCSNLRLFLRKADNALEASSAIVYSSIMEI